MTRTKATFRTNCVHSTAEKIDAMMDTAKDITFVTFWRAVDKAQVKALFPDYEWGRAKGLRLKDDYAVSYYHSHFDGVLAFILQHSAIEYIFTVESEASNV